MNEQITNGLTELLKMVVTAGPWGVIGIVVSILAVLGGGIAIVRNINKGVDSSDEKNSGEHAGKTSVELKTQADKLKDWEKALR